MQVQDGFLVTLQDVGDFGAEHGGVVGADEGDDFAGDYEDEAQGYYGAHLMVRVG